MPCRRGTARSPSRRRGRRGGGAGRRRGKRSLIGSRGAGPGRVGGRQLAAGAGRGPGGESVGSCRLRSAIVCLGVGAPRRRPRAFRLPVWPCVAGVRGNGRFARRGRCGRRGRHEARGLRDRGLWDHPRRSFGRPGHRSDGGLGHRSDRRSGDRLLHCGAHRRARASPPHAAHGAGRNRRRRRRRRQLAHGQIRRGGRPAQSGRCRERAGQHDHSRDRARLQVAGPCLHGTDV